MPSAPGRRDAIPRTKGSMSETVGESLVQKVEKEKLEQEKNKNATITEENEEYSDGFD